MPENIKEEIRREHDFIANERFRDDLRDVLNKHSVENLTDTPDWILAEYLFNCLQAYHVLHRDRKHKD